MKKSLPLLVLAVSFVLAAPARADIVYQFATPGIQGTLGTEQDYTSNGYQIGTYGFKSTFTSGAAPELALGEAKDLYANDTSGETGLGISANSGHEINGKSTVEVNLSSIFVHDPYAAVELTISSVQNGAGFAVFGGLSGPTDYLGSVTGDSKTQTIDTFDITAANVAASGGVFYVTATDKNVLLNAVDVVTVSEPSSIVAALTGMGMLGARGWLRRRRRGAKRSAAAPSA